MTDQERTQYEALLDEILELRTAAGLTPGIYCAERCQLCGAIQAWSGFICSMAVHHGADSAFVCRRCQGGSLNRRMNRQLDAAPARFCEGCGVAVPRLVMPRSPGVFWCCPDCWPHLGEDGALRALRRRRYIALQHPTLVSLRAHAAEVRAHKRSLDARFDEWSRRGGPRG